MAEMTSSGVIRRHPANPVLSAGDVPYRSTLVFNAGFARFQGRYVCVFRNDYCDDSRPPRVVGTNLGLSFSDDGVKWNVTDRPCYELRTQEIQRAYDPRLTVMDGRCYMCFAADTRHGIRGGIAVTDDFESWQLLSLTVPDNRNMVLLPERIGGRYVRLERPMPIYGRGPENFDIWLSDSPDLRYWGNSRLVLGSEQVPFTNNKIGPGAPPVRTDRGWLAVIHAVDKDDSRSGWGWSGNWTKRYSAGLMLLDLQQPWKVIGLSRRPLLVPEPPYDYETTGGYRDYVIFPTGMILEDDGEVKIYYGAADTVIALATADVHDLLELCQPL